MSYVDWAFAGQVAVCVLVVAGLFVWVGAWLAVAAVRWDSLAYMDARDRIDRGFVPDEPRAWRAVDLTWQQSDAPDMHDMMPALQPERIARHSAEMEEIAAPARIDASLDAMDADEHAVGFV